jgi:hypothetical protein
MEERRGDTSGVAIAAEVMGGYGPLLEPPVVVSRAAQLAKTLKSKTPAKLYVYKILLERSGASPPGHGAGTPAVHPGRACCGVPATPPPAQGCGRRRSAPHWNSSEAGRDMPGQ